MRTIISAIAIAIAALSLSAQTMLQYSFTPMVIAAKAPTTSAGVMSFINLNHNDPDVRGKVMSTNAAYIAKVLATMSTLANDEASRNVCEAYKTFFADPSSDDYRFSTACALLNLAYSGTTDLAVYIIDDIYSKDLGNTAVAPNRTKQQLSQEDAIRTNAKYLGFSSEMSKDAMTAIAAAAHQADADSVILSKRAPSTTTVANVEDDNQ
jgi:hypothetical protein